MRMGILSAIATLLMLAGSNLANAQVYIQTYSPVPTYSYSYGYPGAYYSVPVYRYSVPPVVVYPSNSGFSVGYGSYYPAYGYGGWGPSYYGYSGWGPGYYVGPRYGYGWNRRW